MIRVQEVTKAYDESVVVDGVDLTIPAGGMTCLIGPNGAGKSTLLSIIGRLLGADAGRVLVDGLDVAESPSREVAKRLAMLRQENHLAVRLTVRDLVSFGRFPHSRGRLTAEDERHIDEAITQLELEPFEGRFLDELSGGQRQRAFVAMVLAQDTRYLLLDEPLNNLDMRHARSMMGRLRRAADELGTTIVVVVHDVNAASAFADHVIAMRDGVVVAEGTPDEVIRAEVLESVFDTPLEVHEVGGHRFVTPFC